MSGLPSQPPPLPPSNDPYDILPEVENWVGSISQKPLWMWLIPHRGFWATPLLCWINSLVFFYMIYKGINPISPSAQTLIPWGANFRPFVVNGQWWRLFTAGFLHAGFLHWLMNMAALFFAGYVLERMIRPWQVLALYLLCLIGGSVGSVVWHPYTVAVGASGAIFGIYGYLLGLLLFKLIPEGHKSGLTISAIVFVSYNLINGITGNIDNAAHIGGLITGFALSVAYAISLQYVKPSRSFSLGWIVMTPVVLLVSFIIIRTLPNIIREDISFMARFEQYERLAQESIENLDGLSVQEQVELIREDGIYFWDENLNMLKEQEEKALPPIIEQRNSILQEYCETQKLGYEYLILDVKSRQREYEVQVDSCFERASFLKEEYEELKKSLITAEQSK